MSDALEAELDRLFLLPPADMVEARNALAAQLRKGGDAKAALRVKSIKRPTPGAWALNQVHFQHPSLLDRALEHAARIRALHARDAVASGELWSEVSAQRSVANEVVQAALSCCERAGLPHGAGQQKRILATVQGWLAGLGDEAPGRMTHDLEAGGFDAIASVGAAAQRAPVARPAVPAQPFASPAAPRELGARPARLTAVSPAPEPRELLRARGELRAWEQRARQAHAQLLERRAEQSRAERDVERARERAREAEEALAQARATVHQRESELTLGRSRLEEAVDEQSRSEAALAAARAALAELQARSQPSRRR